MGPSQIDSLAARSFSAGSGASLGDFPATMLHCLGIDHPKFTHRFEGRDFRLTDVSGEVVKPLLA